MIAPDAPLGLALDPDRALALAYVPRDRRRAMAALWALDLRMADVVRAAREPALGAIRLAWWRDALCALDDGPPPAEPLLMQIAARLLSVGVRGAMLATVPGGWAPLLTAGEPDDRTDDREGDQALESIAVERGAALFAAGARVLGCDADDRVRAAGEGWALVDVAFGVRSPTLRARALAAAAPALARAAGRWPAALRPLSMLLMLAADDARLGSRAQGSPARAFRMLRHRIGGR